MDEILSKKIDILKALGITIVVAGHLGIWNNFLFPPYSFHVVLFFFISGMLFKNFHIDNIKNYIKRRIKSLIIPYYLYFLLYFVITYIYYKISGDFLGLELNIKNIFLTPFINGHQLDFLNPAWFVPQLFITLFVFIFLQKSLKDRSYFTKNILYFILCIGALFLAKYNNAELNPYLLILIRTMFTLFFVHLGNIYINKIRFKKNIFTPKILVFIMMIQIIIFLYAKYNEIDLGYELVWGYFNGEILLPVITSLSGIWLCMFAVNLFYNRLKNIKPILHIGKNTYHIMANHLFSFFILTQILNKIFNIPIETSGVKIYEYCNIEHTCILYIVFGILFSLFFGAIFKKLKNVSLYFISREP